MLTWRHRDPRRVAYFIRRAMFQDLEVKGKVTPEVKVIVKHVTVYEHINKGKPTTDILL